MGSTLQNSLQRGGLEETGNEVIWRASARREGNLGFMLFDILVQFVDSPKAEICIEKYFLVLILSYLILSCQLIINH